MIQVRADVEAFKQYTPLITALRSPGMRDRHWDKISGDIGVDVHPDDSYTLEKVIDMGLMTHLDAIVKVSRFMKEGVNGFFV